MAKVWIDFDPAGLVYTGLDVDDDLAFIAALALRQEQKINIVGASIVGGNAPLIDTFENAKRLYLHLCKNETICNFLSQIPISPGISWNDMHIAWPSFKNLHKYRKDIESSNDAAQSIIQAIHQHEIKSITILMLGPPSNLALAMKIDPSIIDRIGKVVLMGGSLDAGRYALWCFLIICVNL